MPFSRYCKVASARHAHVKNFWWVPEQIMRSQDTCVAIHFSCDLLHDILENTGRMSTRIVCNLSLILEEAISCWTLPTLSRWSAVLYKPFDMSCCFLTRSRRSCSSRNSGLASSRNSWICLLGENAISAEVLIAPLILLHLIDVSVDMTCGICVSK